jgi:hypothetical protein
VSAKIGVAHSMFYAPSMHDRAAHRLDVTSSVDACAQPAVFCDATVLDLAARRAVRAESGRFRAAIAMLRPWRDALR